jgi:hypothetical protein
VRAGSKDAYDALFAEQPSAWQIWRAVLAVRTACSNGVAARSESLWDLALRLQEKDKD